MICTDYFSDCGGDCLEAPSQILSLLVSRFQPAVDKILFSANSVVGWKQRQACAACWRSAPQACTPARSGMRSWEQSSAFPATPKAAEQQVRALWLRTEAILFECAQAAERRSKKLPRVIISESVSTLLRASCLQGIGAVVTPFPRALCSQGSALVKQHQIL